MFKLKLIFLQSSRHEQKQERYSCTTMDNSCTTSQHKLEITLAKLVFWVAPIKLSPVGRGLELDITHREYLFISICYNYDLNDSKEVWSNKKGGKLFHSFRLVSGYRTRWTCGFWCSSNSHLLAILNAWRDPLQCFLKIILRFLEQSTTRGEVGTTCCSPKSELRRQGSLFSGAPRVREPRAWAEPHS